MLLIPRDKTIQDFQSMLKLSALSGVTDTTPAEILNQLRCEPMYDLNWVISEVTKALVAENEERNCITGNSTEHVIVTRSKLDEVLRIIKDGRMKLDDDE